MGFINQTTQLRGLNAMETDTEVYNQLLPCHTVTVTRQPPLDTIQMNEN